MILKGFGFLGLSFLSVTPEVIAWLMVPLVLSSHCDCDPCKASTL